MKPREIRYGPATNSPELLMAFPPLPTHHSGSDRWRRFEDKDTRRRRLPPFSPGQKLPYRTHIGFLRVFAVSSSPPRLRVKKQFAAGMPSLGQAPMGARFFCAFLRPVDRHKN